MFDRGNLNQDSMFMALRSKPPPLTFSNKAMNFYSSEYRKDDGMPILVQNSSDRNHQTMNQINKQEISHQPKFSGNFDIQRSTLRDQLRTTASGTSISNLMQSIQVTQEQNQAKRPEKQSKKYELNLG